MIYCCSDTHGRPIPRIQNPGAPGYSCWLHAGDVYDKGVSTKSPKWPADRFNGWFDQVDIPVFAVHGNHDCFLDMPFFDKAYSASGNCVRLSDTTVLVGIGWHGSVYYEIPTEKDLEKVCSDAMRQILFKTTSKDRFILLTHYPAYLPELYNIRSKAGWFFDCVRSLIEEIKPILVVQGHAHELAGQDGIFFGKGFQSRIINPGPSGLAVDIVI